MKSITENKLIPALSRLVANECANHLDGMCLPKDKPCNWYETDINPDTGARYPFGDKGITCPYFLKAVLPGNKRLETLYFAFLDDYDGKRSLNIVTDYCKRCGAPIVKASNRQKYCASCREDARRRTKARWERENYAKQNHARERGSSVDI